MHACLAEAGGTFSNLFFFFVESQGRKFKRFSLGMSPGVETWGCREYAESTLQDQSYLMGIGLCCWSLDIHFYWKKRAFFLSVEDGFKQFLFSARPLGT